MKYVIYDNATGKFLINTGKNIEQVDNLQDADIYKKKLTSLWWEDSYELVPVGLFVDRHVGKSATHYLDDIDRQLRAH